jgi:hypothetical protein
MAEEMIWGLHDLAHGSDGALKIGKPGWHVAEDE